MPITLVRIDDRLVHGQVVEGWIPYLKADMVVVVSDQAAGDPTQQALMQLGLPEDVELRVLECGGAAKDVSDLQKSAKRALVLVPGPREALDLLEQGIEVPSVNVGGIHFSAGRIQLGKVIFLNEEDRQALRSISDRGVQLEGRAVPTDKKTDIAELL